LAGVKFSRVKNKKDLEMKRRDEVALKIAKEIVVKFIEVGRLSLSSFDDAWKQIHRAVRNSISEEDPEE